MVLFQHYSAANIEYGVIGQKDRLDAMPGYKRQNFRLIRVSVQGAGERNGVRIQLERRAADESILEAVQRYIARRDFQHVHIDGRMLGNSLDNAVVSGDNSPPRHNAYGASCISLGYSDSMTMTIRQRHSLRRCGFGIAEQNAAGVADTQPGVRRIARPLRKNGPDRVP